ncbi:hypothetical protein GOV10_04415 [Candidatus Woesearchaeota archaeon]|nr:hypothetical protein [Candidatus Woesearchaeota archaeon]
MRRAVMTGLALLCATGIYATEPTTNPTEPARMTYHSEQARYEQLKNILSDEALERIKEKESINLKDALPEEYPLLDVEDFKLDKSNYNFSLGVECERRMCEFVYVFQNELESYFRRHPRQDRIPEQTIMSNYRQSIEYPGIHEFLFDGPKSEQAAEKLSSKGSNALLVFFPKLEKLGFALEEQFDEKINGKISFKHNGRFFQDASYGGKAQLSGGDFLGLRSKAYLRDGKKENRLDPIYMAREYRPRIDLEWFPKWSNIVKGEMGRGELTLNCRFPLWYDSKHMSIPYVTGTYFFNEHDQGFAIRTNIFFDLD